MPKPHRGRSEPSTGDTGPSAQLTEGRPYSTSARSSGPANRPTYVEAVGRYERGMRALQEHRFQDAADAFRDVLARYPEEKELNDRVRLYLSLCQRQLSRAPEPRTLDEWLYAATLALNAGDKRTAMRYLGEVVAREPSHDGALYMLGVAYALDDDPEKALSYLRRAIQQNPQNHRLALQDGDLERLMQDPSVRAGLEAAAGRSGDTQTSPRHRPIR
jgi:tetratricopeptide (TPR) repeat protein